MPKSAVAGILEKNGGIRVVVGPLLNMACHVQDGERLFLVHGFKVQEPVERVAELIDKVVAHVRNELRNETYSNRR